MPSRILLTTLGSYGDINPFVGLALGLKARGHEAAIATSAFYREYIEAAGIRCIVIRPDVDPSDLETVRRITSPLFGTRYLIKTLLMNAVRDSFDDLRAAAPEFDLLVTHPITFAGPVVAEELRMPWISTVLSPISFFSAHDMPVVPPAPWLRRLHRIPGLSRSLVAGARAASRSWAAPVASLRRDRGLPPGANPMFEGQHSPRGVLALFSRVLAQPQPDWPAQAQLTGPIFHSANGGAQLDAATLAFLDHGPAPVVFTLGSTAVAVADEFYAVSAAAAARLGVRAVLVTGGHERNVPPALPPSVHVMPVASFPDLLPRAAAVVHPGGVGTLHHALAAGLPMLVVPHGNDQPDNAHRARELGVARVTYPSRYKVGAVSRNLAALLGDEGVRRRAEAVGEIVRNEDGVGGACDEIEMML
ncbi:MAG: glycosyltransferase [Gemmatimonadales bacterium]